MSIIADCQSCGRKLRVPDELLGRAVKCPTCGKEFEARADTAPALQVVSETNAAAPAPPPLLEEEPAEDTKHCRGCGRTLPRAAQRCPHCDEDLRGSGAGRRPWESDPPPSYDSGRPWDQPALRRDCEPERGGLILTLGILSLFLPLLGPVLGITALVMAIGDMRNMRLGQMDPRGMNATQAGMICGIIGTVLEGFLSLCCGFCLLGAIVPAAAPPPPAPPPRPVPPPKRGVLVATVGDLGFQPERSYPPSVKAEWKAGSIAQGTGSISSARLRLLLPDRSQLVAVQAVIRTCHLAPAAV